MEISYMNRSIERIILLFTLLALAASLNCGSSRQLDRKKAAERIEGAPQFRQVFYVVVAHQRNQRHLDPETAPADARGEAAAVADFFNSSPYRGVLKELSLVTVKARFAGVEDGRNVFDLDIRLTDAGRKLWQEAGAPVNEAAIPLAKRELLEVTGLTGGDATQAARAEAEFTWQWVPTAAGRAMMRGTPEFARLPDRIRQQFDAPGLTVFDIGAHRPLELGGVHQANAQFQLYDDGWRLTDVQPMDTSPLNPID
jgi:hypothetical protein